LTKPGSRPCWSRCRGDRAFLADLLDTFLAEAPNLLAAMRQALARQDAAGLCLAAHSLKSNSRDFGAAILFGLCLELEMRGKSGTLDGAAEELAQAEVEYDRVRAELEALRSAECMAEASLVPGHETPGSPSP
jgi:HPt (histidine-containing phosphotransfer) domain-containing protein